MSNFYCHPGIAGGTLMLLADKPPIECPAVADCVEKVPKAAAT
jgi:hypothetical protein